MIGVHHLYFGLLAIFLAWFGMWRDWPLWLFVSLFVVGVWLCADDIYQHWRQKQLILAGYDEADDPIWEPDADYRSPVHRIYVWAFGWLHRRVVRWFKRG